MAETAVERGTKILAGRYRQGLGATALNPMEFLDDGAANDRKIAELSQHGHRTPATNVLVPRTAILGPENLIG